jgi:hypothetical protein
MTFKQLSIGSGEMGNPANDSASSREAAQLIQACDRLSTLLEAAAEACAPELPDGVRLEIRGFAALLSFSNWEEIARWGSKLQIDLRDLNERELAYLERVSISLVQRWRTEGTGPMYRNEAGIRYSLRDIWEWRRKGRQAMTAQGVRRGRRKLDE